MFREALDALITKPDGRRLGYRLRQLRRRVIDGRFIDLAGVSTGTNRWAVFGVEQFRERPKPCPPCPPCPPKPDADPVDMVDMVDMFQAADETQSGSGSDEPGIPKPPSQKRYCTTTGHTKRGPERCRRLRHPRLVRP